VKATIQLIFNVKSQFNVIYVDIIQVDCTLKKEICGVFQTN